MTTLTDLHDDHINISRLLNLIDQKVEKLKSGERPDYMLLCDAIRFIADHAEQHHHPKEDIMYAFFAKRNPELDKLTGECITEHEALKGCGHRLLDAIEDIMHDTVVPVDVLVKKLELFIGTEREHINFEEGRVFPAITRVADQADWQALDASIPKVKDPLFGENITQEYNYLHKNLSRSFT